MAAIATAIPFQLGIGNELDRNRPEYFPHVFEGVDGPAAVQQIQDFQRWKLEHD